MRTTSDERRAAAEARIAALADCGEDQPRPSPASWARNALIFALVLIACALAITRWLDSSPQIRLEEGLPLAKFRWLQAHKDDYDIVFVGSSRVYRHISPVTFDKHLARLGHDVTSYNLGFPGSWLPEVIQSVDWILALEPARLAYLVIEVQEFDADVLRAQEDVTWRHIRWHTPENLALVAQLALRSERPLLEKLQDLRLSFVHFLYRAANIGTGMPAAFSLLGYERRSPPTAESDGFRPLELEEATGSWPTYRARRDELRENVHRLEERIAYLRDEGAEATDRVLQEALRELTRRVRARGVQPIFLLQPSIGKRYPGVYELHRSGEIPTLLAYNDPDRFPEFFRIGVLFDIDHLNTRGAAMLTRRMAADVDRLLRAAEGN